MNKRIGWILIVLAVVALAMAQTAAEKAKRSTEILAKARQMDVMNQLLPIMLTKDQLNKILPEVERARASLKKLEANEYDTLIKLEPKVDKALKEGYDEGKTVSTTTTNEAFATFRLFENRRIAVGSDASERITALLDKILTVGQKRSMEGALRPQLINPDVDPRKMSASDKMAFFVQVVLLDDASYDVLLKLSKTAR